MNEARYQNILCSHSLEGSSGWKKGQKNKKKLFDCFFSSKLNSSKFNVFRVFFILRESVLMYLSFAKNNTIYTRSRLRRLVETMKDFKFFLGHRSWK